MSRTPEFLNQAYDPRDPSPWLALYLDQSTPLPDAVKAAWLADSSSASRQYLLPFLRPLARLAIVLFQVLKVFVPRNWAHSRLLHRFLAWGLARFVSPEANWLILRHFHLGSQVLAFIGRNSPAPIDTAPLEPQCIDDLKEDMFLQHDLNLFNFVIRLNTALRQRGLVLGKAEPVDLTMIREPGLQLSDMPRGRLNFLDLQSAIELFTPLYQLMLTDNDFWRAANSLQLDETIGIYAATVLAAPEHLILVNNKHPLVPLSTLRAGHRLTIHGLSTEMLHALLIRFRDAQSKGIAGQTAGIEQPVA